MRRLRFVVDFLPPRPDERLALWQRALPKGARGREHLDDIDLRMLAADMQLTGAEIKSTALAAAFLARRAGTRIGLEHIAAAQREIAKQGAARDVGS